MTLTFKESSHRYRLDGKAVTGATTIIGGGVPKPALTYWAANQAAEAAADWAASFKDLPPSEAAWNLASIDRDSLYEEWRKAPWKKRDEAAVRGTAVHALAERVIHGEDVDVHDELVPYVEGYVDFLDTWDVTPILTEKSVASREHWYAGRFDLIATVPTLHGGEPIEIDLKTSRGVYADTAIQTAAYARAEFYVEDDDPDTEHAIPDVAATYVAHVTAEGTTLYELSPDREHIDQSFRTFLAALAVKGRWNPKTLQEVTR
ncbi:hypothetical protein [Brachybacterium subflavum]|uniref:hypothetical protein n=1 Tax=Brachybacterium subflavum TaxID=2585206 RepID=UPI0012662F1D|nr:hypothetical protein [Brachybacterium subflavum]